MNTAPLEETLSDLKRLISLTQPTDSGAPAHLSGELLRALSTQGLALFTAIRTYLSSTTDPRLALELATTGQLLEAEATRISLTAADRLAATNAHTLDEQELNLLRTTAPQTDRAPSFCTGRPSFLNPASLLASWIHLPHTQASTRIHNASDLICRRDLTGASLPPRFPHLGTLFADTTQNPQRVLSVSEKLAKREPVDQTFDGIRTEVTLQHPDGHTLEEHAARLLTAPVTVKESDKQLGELLQNAASTNATATNASLRRGFFRLRVSNTLTREYLLRVTVLEAERLESAIAQANNPRTRAGQAARRNPRTTSPNTNINATASTDRPDFLPAGVSDEDRWEPEAEADLASIPERTLNAFMSIISTTEAHTAPQSETTATVSPAEGVSDADSSEDAPTVVFEEVKTCPSDDENPANASKPRKLIRPELVVHLRLDDLKNLAAGQARTAHGLKLPPDELRNLLCSANIIPSVFGAKGELLDYGRARRLVPEKLKKAVLARDHGCLVPGCTAPPEMIEYHHLDPWFLGGKTRLEDLCPGCLGHHLDYDAGRIKIVVIDGLPYVILPKHIDPEQKPLRNHYYD